MDGIPVAWQSTDLAVLEAFGISTPSPSQTSSVASSTATDSSSAKQTSSASKSKLGLASATETSTIVQTITTGAQTAAPTITAAPGAWSSGSLLIGSCGNADWTLMDLSTSYLWAPVKGCDHNRPECCPFAIGPAAKKRRLLRRDGSTPTAAPSGPFPTAVGGWAANLLGQCPDDYDSVSGGCCPSGQTLYGTLLGSQTVCVGGLAPMTPPAIPSSLASGMSSNVPISTASDRIFAEMLYVAPPSTGLSLGAKIGIGVGAGVGVLLIIGIVVFSVLKCRKRGDKTDKKSPIDANRVDSEPSWTPGMAAHDVGAGRTPYNANTYNNSNAPGAYGAGAGAVAGGFSSLNEKRYEAGNGYGQDDSSKPYYAPPQNFPLGRAVSREGQHAGSGFAGPAGAAGAVRSGSRSGSRAGDRFNGPAPMASASSLRHEADLDSQSTPTTSPTELLYGKRTGLNVNTSAAHSKNGSDPEKDFLPLGSPVDDGAPWMASNHDVGPVPSPTGTPRMRNGSVGAAASGRMSPAVAAGAVGAGAAVGSAIGNRDRADSRSASRTGPLPGRQGTPVQSPTAGAENAASSPRMMRPPLAAGIGPSPTGTPPPRTDREGRESPANYRQHNPNSASGNFPFGPGGDFAGPQRPGSAPRSDAGSMRGDRERERRDGPPRGYPGSQGPQGPPSRSDMSNRSASEQSGWNERYYDGSESYNPPPGYRMDDGPYGAATGGDGGSGGGGLRPPHGRGPPRQGMRPMGPPGQGGGYRGPAGPGGPGGYRGPSGPGGPGGYRGGGGDRGPYPPGPGYGPPRPMPVRNYGSGPGPGPYPRGPGSDRGGYAGSDRGGYERNGGGSERGGYDRGPYPNPNQQAF
jgi:hypothetical protein